MVGICRFCSENKSGTDFDKWVRPTFTNYDKLQPGNIICNDCIFWFNEADPELAKIVGKEKPQRMRNYSHFIVNGKWTPLSKGNKKQMRDFLLTPPFPELAVIADSGQKHIAFQATRNPEGGKAGWVQYEEETIWVEPDKLVVLIEIITKLLNGFSKGEIESGGYFSHRIKDFGLSSWRLLEDQLTSHRGTRLFALAIFLAQKKEQNEE